MKTNSEIISVCSSIAKLNRTKSSFLMWSFWILCMSFSIPISAQITRTQIINNAIPYTSFTWSASSCNFWNGTSCGGRNVYRAPWVVVGSNVSMPYMWGGWSTTTQHISAMTNCKSAGDVCSVSGGNCSGNGSGLNQQCASGHDCSGLVSRAWALTSKYATTTLPNISTSIALTQTQPGDILNLVSSHTRLIETNYGNGTYRVIEASGTDWKTAYHSYTTINLSSYSPRVYDNVSGGTLPGSFTLTLTPECNGTTSQIRLNWTASSGATSYDIYRNGSIYANGITGLQYINSGNITVGNTYSYYVQAKNTSGSTNSNTQSAVAPNCSGSITIIVPNGGEIWQVGTTHNITWNSSGVTSTIQIQPYLNGQPQPNINSSAPNTGSYSWTIPTNFPTGTTYKMSLSANNGTVWDYSDGNFSITPLTPTVTTTIATDITNNTATSGGNVTSDGGATVTARGVCWSTGSNPTTGNSHTSNGTGTGIFTSSITGLSPGTQYHYRAYATNSSGTNYGSDRTFTTQVNVVPPTVTTTIATDITNNTATSGGNVTSDGGATVTARGVCWSTGSNPTTGNSHTTNGTGTGIFTSSITGLSPGTQYHYRAYATNSAGTSYGTDLTFVTPTSAFMITGTVTYNNTVATPISGATVILKSGTTTISTTQTAINGSYSFNNISNGTYIIEASTNKPWGGVASSDALDVLRYVATIITIIDPLKLKACDVNASGTYTAFDAQLILQRIAFLINSFPAGDWYFENPQITVFNSNVTSNFKCICFGDVNGSYIPQ